MTRPRGRPAKGEGLSRDEVLAAALDLLATDSGQGLTMRALAARLGITPMALYHHVEDRTGLLRALSDRVYAEVLGGEGEFSEHRAKIRAILVRYHDAVGRHPQLTLAIFATPEAFAGVTRQITDRLSVMLGEVTDNARLWCDILIDHAHGSGLALCSAHDEPQRSGALREQYQQALDELLDHLLASYGSACVTGSSP